MFRPRPRRGSLPRPEDIANRDDEIPAHLRPVMIVKSPPHARVRVVGLGRFVPASTIDVDDSTGVVAADRCVLRSVDHYHVHRASVDMRALHDLSPGGSAALARLLADPADRAAIHDFQRSLPGEPPRVAEGDTEVRRPVAARHNVFVSHGTGVQTGSDSTLKVRTDYVVEETFMPLVDLLRDNDGLVTCFAEAMRAPGSAPATTAFCREVLRAVHEVDELTRLAQATDLMRVNETTLWSFFGIAQVEAASAVLIGQDNRLDEKLRIDLPGVGRPGLLADLGELRDVYGPVVETPGAALTLHDLEALDPMPPPGRLKRPEPPAIDDPDSPARRLRRGPGFPSPGGRW